MTTDAAVLELGRQMRRAVRERRESMDTHLAAYDIAANEDRRAAAIGFLRDQKEADDTYEETRRAALGSYCDELVALIS